MLALREGAAVPPPHTATRQLPPPAVFNLSSLLNASQPLSLFNLPICLHFAATGAIRVNPWGVDSVRGGMYRATDDALRKAHVTSCTYRLILPGITFPPPALHCSQPFLPCPPTTGAIRVNPWSVDSVSDGMYSAIRTPLEHRRLRHEKHWKYVSNHTVAYWAQSYIGDLQVSGEGRW